MIEVPPPAVNRFKKTLAVAEPVSVAVLFVFLLWKSWLRGPDPLVDFPRELYSAWRLSQGDLLYTQVVSWYGPLPLLMEGGAFHVFGIGLDTIAWLNVGITIIALLLLRGIFGQLGNRLSVWLGSVVFLTVFAFGQLAVVSNFNFITPYASQATYGLVGLWLTLWALLRHGVAGGRRWLWLAGAGLGLAYLSKPEPLLAAAAILAIYFSANILRHVRRPVPASGIGGVRWATQALAWIAGGFLCIWTPVCLIFASQGGMAYAFLASNWVPHTMLSQSFVNTATSGYGKLVFGFNAPWNNFCSHFAAGGLLILAGAVLMFGN